MRVFWGRAGSSREINTEERAVEEDSNEADILGAEPNDEALPSLEEAAAFFFV
jgi:hypothetical protein